MLTFTRGVRRIVSLMRQVVAHRPPRHLFYFASLEKLDQRGRETNRVFLDPDDFFIPVRQGNRIDVVERESGDRAIPTAALTGLPATSPRSLSLREDRQEEDNHWKSGGLGAARQL
ncbi:MAG TPA: hypothetical protein VNO70_08550 [Blastocatellia bacterium]|nr:hypothetical protein [Blastocatellia bacterium]